MRIAILQHAESEGPGEIGLWAQEHRHEIQVAHLYRGESLPALDSFQLMVVMGGEMNIYQYRDYPWLLPERKLIAAALAAGRRVVGICLGAQLIADALGARVTQNAEYELGWFPIETTPAAREFFPVLPERPTVLHWHGDAFELPTSAMRLASSAGCPNQGYMIPGQCLGLQFHFEADAALASTMVEGQGADWPTGRYVQSGEEIRRQADSHHLENRRILHGMLDRFCA